MKIFGTYADAPKPYAFNGQPGWFSVPAGRNWYCVTDKGQQIWVSPNPLTLNEDGTVSGAPKYAAELNQDGTLVFQEKLAQRKMNQDSPPRDRLSQFS